MTKIVLFFRVKKKCGEREMYEPKKEKNMRNKRERET